MSFACVCAIMWHWSSMFFSNICSSFLFFFNNPGCPGHTTRFHSFTDGPIPSVYDYKFVGDFFTDVIADGLRPSAFPSSVIPHSVGISVGKTKKPFPDGFTDGICAQKKKIPAWNIPTDFYSVGDIVITDGKYPSVMTSVSLWNTDRICPSVNSSVIVEAIVKCRRINSVGKSVGECLKYRPNSSVGKILGNSFFLNLFLKNYLGYII